MTRKSCRGSYNFMVRVFRLHDFTRKGWIKSSPGAVQAGGRASSCSQQCLGRQERHLGLLQAACETQLPRRKRGKFVLERSACHMASRWHMVPQLGVRLLLPCAGLCSAISASTVVFQDMTVYKQKPK